MNKYDQFVESQATMREHLLDVAKQRDLSMMALAKLIGISRNTLMYFIKGERYLGFRTLGKIEKFLEKYDVD
jgi:transcriptional regulator with XRE-family HTH domain